MCFFGTALGLGCNILKLFCIDYGLTRTGIAVTDAGGRMAFPRCTIHAPAQSKRSVFFEKLLEQINIEEPAAIVVGLPLLIDGSDSLTTKQVRNFVNRLKRRTELPIYFMPELLSSNEALDDLRQSNLPSHKHKAVLDQQAAVRILQSFLEEPVWEQRRV